MAGAEAEMNLGAPRVVDPGVAILEEIHRSAGHVAWLEAKCRELEASELVWSQVMEFREEGTVPGGRGGGSTIDVMRTEHRATINIWWQMYERERQHLVRCSAAAIRAGIEERRVRLAERGMDALEAAISAAMQELGHDPHDTRVRAIIGKHIAGALEGAPAPGTQAGEEYLQPRVVDMEPLVTYDQAERAMDLPDVGVSASSSSGDAGIPEPVDF